jgi:hypothetical protein
MIDELFERMLDSNQKFWQVTNKGKDKNRYVLYECFTESPLMIYGGCKITSIIANIKALDVIAVTPVKMSNKNYKLLSSFDFNLVGSKSVLFKTFIFNLRIITGLFFKIRSKQSLLSMTINGISIGPYIHDHILRVNGIPELKHLNYKIRLRVLLEVIYFLYFQYLFRKFNIDLVMLNDNVYRHGLILELAKSNQIECIAPISINSLLMAKYITNQDYEVSCRRPELDELNSLSASQIGKNLSDYLSNRFQANVNQHDVLTAFSNEKKILNRSEIVKQYKLDVDKPIVVVMAHIFCDAPHAYPGALYDDYYEWTKKTVSVLQKNKNINFLIKEHPSVHLYNEDGIMYDLLKSLNCEKLLIDGSMHTSSVLDECDVIVTCGGTAGLEFLYKGKQVVVAARPPYSEFGVTTDFTTRDEYEIYLSMNKFSDFNFTNRQKDLVNRILYYDFIALDNYSDNLELGGQRYLLKGEINFENLYNEIIGYNKTPIRQQSLYKLLLEFVKSDKRHVANNYRC